jgi:hypothetical protein
MSRVKVIDSRSISNIMYLGVSMTIGSECRTSTSIAILGTFHLGGEVPNKRFEN